MRCSIDARHQLYLISLPVLCKVCKRMQAVHCKSQHWSDTDCSLSTAKALLFAAPHLFGRRPASVNLRPIVRACLPTKFYSMCIYQSKDNINGKPQGRFTKLSSSMWALLLPEAREIQFRTNQSWPKRANRIPQVILYLSKEKTFQIALRILQISLWDDPVLCSCGFNKEGLAKAKPPQASTLALPKTHPGNG